MLSGGNQCRGLPRDQFEEMKILNSLFPPVKIEPTTVAFTPVCPCATKASKFPTEDGSFLYGKKHEAAFIHELTYFMSRQVHSAISALSRHVRRHVNSF